MWIDASWQQQGLEALRATFNVETKKRNEMIQFLYDEGFWDIERLTWDAGVARWNDCLNPSKSAFFKMGELWALMKRFGNHDLFEAMAADLGYEIRRRPTEERRMALLERIAQATEGYAESIAAAQAELARLHAPTGEKVSAPARPSSARFAIGDQPEGRGF
jgi:hypothetical protein